MALIELQRLVCAIAERGVLRLLARAKVSGLRFGCGVFHRRKFRTLV